MKIMIKTDIEVNGIKYESGTIVDMNETSALRLIDLRWAEKVEAVKPKKTTKKK